MSDAPRVRYNRVTEGEWVQPRRRGYRMMCCDCGLVHVLNFRIKKRRIQLQAFRDNRATANSRRARRNRGESVAAG